MNKEKALTHMLAVAFPLLDEMTAEKDQYQDWWIKKNAECDTLKTENIKLKRDLEFVNAELTNAKAALKVWDELAVAAEQDESPFTMDED